MAKTIRTFLLHKFAIQQADPVIKILMLLLMWMLVTPAFTQDDMGMLSGQILNRSNGEPLPDCDIVVLTAGRGTISDSLGLYVLRLSPGIYTIEFSHLGFETVVKKITLIPENPRLRLTVEMVPKVLEGKSVTVLEQREAAAPGMQELQQADIRNMPTLYSDVLRTIKILPGVSSNNELSSAYNVRGGNFDENLIYLNGYEIYQPFLLRQGVEENQSLINPDMMQDLLFYAGAFPANLGDKLSSALQVNYKRNVEPGLSGTVRVDLFNAGVMLQNRQGKWRWIVGLRYANPELFVNRLQTSGGYRPLFTDGQILINYQLSSAANLELFILQAYNRFDLTPENWEGNFKFSIVDIKAVEINYDGERNYSFNTGLVGLKLNKKLADDRSLTLSLARYDTREDEDMDLRGDIFYKDDANNSQSERRFLKTRIEKANNSLDLQSYEFQSSFQQIDTRHTFSAGFNARLVKLRNVLDEFFVEEDDSTTAETPLIQQENQELNLAYLSAYARDVITFNKQWQATLGVRALHYDYNNETLLSPRASLRFDPHPRNTLNARFGLYYQPPFFYELRDKNPDTISTLKSQKALHFILGWEHRFEKNLKFQAETYYKKLDDIIPYYLDQLKLVYGDRNSHEGYAYGLDILLQGEIVKTMNSWIGYSFLSTKERESGGNSIYQRRLLDQTHTVRIFLQDKIPRHPNIQAHMRMLYGSGYLYHPRQVVYDQASGEPVLAVNFDQRRKFQSYQRVDLGLSGRFKLGGKREIIIVTEVLNVFNHFNVAAYSWFHVFPGQPIRVPHVYTRRFFNIGVEVGF